MEGFTRLAAIRHYLATGYHTPGTSGMQRSSVCRAAKSYVIEMDRLFYVGSGKRRLVVLSPEERDKVLVEYHDHPSTGGHGGVQKIIEKITARYYWLGIARDVQNWIGSCEPCQRHEKIKTVALKLHPIKVHGPWEVMGVDLIGLLTQTPRGYTHILTFTDLFSKWVMARPLKGKNGPGVGLLETLLEHGGVRKIITDMGREFVN